MNRQRRALALAGAALCAIRPLQSLAQATAYPSGPVKVIVPFAPGGIVDVMARLVADELGRQLQQPFYVENRPGATSTLGTAALKASAADGQTILFGTSSIELLNPFLFKKLPYQVADLQRVSVIYDSSIALVVPRKSKVGNFKELVAYAKSKGNGVTFGSWGAGSSGHLFGVMLENAFGIKLVHVPYKGEIGALTDMARGDLDMTWASPNGARTFREKGDSVVIGSTGSARSPALPDVPTFAEQGFESFNLGLYGVAYAPKGTPTAIVDQLQRAIHAAVVQAAVKERFATMGLTPVGSTPAQFDALFTRERPIWQKLVETSGATLD